MPCNIPSDDPLDDPTNIIDNLDIVDLFDKLTIDQQNQILLFIAQDHILIDRLYHMLVAENTAIPPPEKVCYFNLFPMVTVTDDEIR